VATIDDKVVAMSFESGKFEQGVSRAIRALDKLKGSLKFDDAGKGISAVSRALGHLQLGRVGQAVDQVSNKLRTFHLVAIGVLANISAQAVRAGARFVKALTLDPIIQGYKEYETKLTAIQTILSNTQAAGVKLKDVTSALNELNHYADKTIYNFSEMTRNVGTFTAAGVDLTTAVASIKGIANLAAVSGSNAEQASTAMYQLSQAISAGTVKLQDWNSVVNAGMGGTLFQRALAQTAQHMGTLKEGAVTLKGAMKNVTINGESFRQSLASAGPGKKSWLTSKVLTTTLKQLSGDLTDAQLKAMGYTDAQVKALQAQAKMAVNAATQVKTLSQLIDTTKEAVGSGWAQTWEIIFGNFGEAKTLFTGLSNAINGFVSTSANARNKVLSDWKELGGRTLFLNALKQGFHDLAAVVRPIRDAFRDIFPAKTGKDLYNLTVGFKNLMDRLEPSAKTVENIRRTFRGLFALLDIGKQVIGGIASVFARLIGATGAGSGGFLDLTGNIGDFLVSVDNALKKGDRLANFFDHLGDILAGPVAFLGHLRDALLNLFTGFSPAGFSGQVDGMTNALTPLQTILEAVAKAWEAFASAFGQSGKIFQPILDGLVTAIQQLGPAVATAIQSMNFEAILAVIRTGLLGGIFLLFKNFFGKGSLLEQVSKGFAGGIMGNISGAFRALEGSMTAIQQNIKAKTLKEIAIAVALLTASVVALSFVDPKKLNSAMAAITVMFAQLLGAMAIMDKVTKSAGFLRMPVVAASLILLAGAIDILAIAVFALSRLSWSELIKGLGGVTVLLIGITAAAVPLAAGSAGMVRAGAGITAMAVGINILALAVRSMGSMPLGQIAKGLGGIAAGLLIVAGAMKIMPPNLILTGAGLVVTAVGLRILAKAVSAFGELDWNTMGKGLVGIAGALIVIAGAMQLMPATMVVSAAGLILVSIALRGIAKAVESLGGMSVSALAKGLISLALALGILAVGLIAMQGAIGGAVALGIAAAGIALLAPALAVLGKQSWGQILKGLVALAAAIAILGVAAILLQPAIPAMLGLGAALILIGGGLALAGVGIALIGVGLSAIAVAAPTAAGVIVQAFIQLQEGIIKNAKLLILGLLEVVNQLAKVAPRFVEAIVKILGTVIDGIIKLAPKLHEVMNTLIVLLLQVLQDNQTKIIQAGFNLLIALLQGIRNNLPQITKLVADIVITLLQSLAKQLNRIQRAGITIILSFVKGIVSNYALIIRTGLNIVVNLIRGIANSIGKIATAGLSIITSLVRAIANNYVKLFGVGATAIANFIRGLGSAAARLVAAGVHAITVFIRAIVTGALKLVNEGAKAIIKFMNGVATAIDQYEPQMIAAGARIGTAIVTGMLKGIALAAPNVLKKAGDLVNSVKKKLEFWKSPPDAYGKWLGQLLISGLATGLTDTSEAVDAAANMSKSVISTVESIFEITSPSKVMRKLGRDVAAGLALGVKEGAEADVRQALQDVVGLVNQQMADARQKIADARQQINRPEKGKKLTKEQIAENKKLNQVIAEQNAILAKATQFHKLLTVEITKHKGRLIELAKEYAKTSDQLDIATNLFEQYLDQYDDLPEIPTVDAEGNKIANPLSDYIKQLTDQVGAVSAYKTVLEKLKALGLDDKTYQMLLDQGPSAINFANQILAGGKPMVDRINQLDGQLDNAAAGLADNAAKELYDVGKRTAQGFVKGLQDHKKEILAQMDDIADEMVKRIKKKLKIKSPSQIFVEFGKQTVEGLAIGISDSSQMVTTAIDTLAGNAVNTMRDSLSGMSDLISLEIDPNPTIQPILDLSQVQTAAQSLDSILKTAPITSTRSFGQAATISSSQATTEEELAAAAVGGTSVKFEQNNYSPEALTEVEIYRQTKNQLSQIKSALALT